MKKLEEVVVVPGGNTDLGKLLGSPVARVEGYASREFGRGVEVFKLSSIVLADGRRLYCEGEHDMPYLPSDEHLTEEQLSSLYVEENGP